MKIYIQVLCLDAPGLDLRGGDGEEAGGGGGDAEEAVGGGGSDAVEGGDQGPPQEEEEGGGQALPEDEDGEEEYVDDGGAGEASKRLYDLDDPSSICYYVGKYNSEHPDVDPAVQGSWMALLRVQGVWK